MISFPQWMERCRSWKWAQRTVMCAAAGVLIALCLVSIPPLIRETFRLSLLNESDHGDSYILYDILQFQKTGIIYRDLSQPPYVPVQYSPLVYGLYSLPGWFITSENPFLGPRLIVIGAFLLCIGIASSITHALVPVRFAWVWGILLACSISSMWHWVLQIRGDFPGICFSLLTIRLLMSRSRWSILLAGLCAGLAIQFKFIFVAAAVAGTLWLIAQRRWKELGKFVAMAGVFSIGLYVLYFIREPQMFSQMLALSPGVKNLSGDIQFGLQAVERTRISSGSGWYTTVHFFRFIAMGAAPYFYDIVFLNCVADGHSGWRKH